MGMVVRSNIMAVNANRQLGMNNSKVSKSLEKLASGFKINRAGDDASGLAISEKMKAQIKGLETASANSQDGVSLIQTAEGALTEVHDMLNRMVELAGKAANGTMDQNVDRVSLQKEVDALKDEIDRVASSTNFNGIKLLDGSLGGGKAGAPSDVSAIIGGAAATTGKIPASAASFTSTGNITAGTQDDPYKFEVSYKDASGVDRTTTVDYAGGANAKGSADAAVAALNANADLKGLFSFSADANGKVTAQSLTTGTKAANVTGFKTNAGGTLAEFAGTAVPAGNGNSTITLGANVAEGDTISINGKTYEMVGTLGDEKKGNIGFTDYDGLVAAAAENGITIGGGNLNNGTDLTVAYDPDAKGTGLTLQIGDTAEEFNRVTVSVGDMSTTGLGISGLSVSDEDSAAAALDLLKNSAGGGAINIVSGARADLGALQNRLEHTINNLDVAAENMTAANSRIRDTDMAKEMMEYTKQNVLTQAAQAMLAQANQQPQSVLQLLQ